MSERARNLFSIFALLCAVAFGFGFGRSAGYAEGHIKGKCETFESFILATGMTQEPGLFPPECPQRGRLST